MKRSDPKILLDLGTKLFEKIYRRKQCCGHNHDAHLMAREIECWLPQGIQSLRDGSYNPRLLKRLYLPDDVVDQLHLSDRIFQHLLLKMIKPTFKFVISPNCYHMAGPSGVKRATAQIQQVLQTQKPKYFIRTDIKSFYKSIVHYKLIKDIKQYYEDAKLISMLENIINNPIEAPYGDLNPYTGIALRGPLSQFFSGIYLKPLDEAIQKMDVTYLRYQDDILILCKTKRQLNRCKRRMMEILHERHLKLSRRKTRMGKIEDGFHFLGVTYLQTQTEDNTDTRYVSDKSKVNTSSEHQTHASSSIIPHPRTLRKARENVKHMVTDGVSRPKIKSYLFRWLCWWARTSGSWKREELLNWFVESCWESVSLQIARALQKDYFTTALHRNSRPF